MTIPLIQAACDTLGLSYTFIDEAKTFIKISLKNGSSHLCIANNLGLNTEVVEKICKDKVYTYQLLHQHLQTPRTTSYIDPNPPEIYQDFVTFSSVAAIVADIIKKNSLPVVLKPNSKSMGMNVFLCATNEEITTAVTEIFNKASYKYDHVLLVQEAVAIHKEFRVLVYKGKIQFIYQKDNTLGDALFEGNLSPLHFANARAVLLDQSQKADADIYAGITAFITPLFEQLDLVYAGLDITQDASGQFCLLEINSKPGFGYFTRDNGTQQVITMFEHIFSDLGS